MNAFERITGTATDVDGKTRIHWQHCVSAVPKFDEHVFDDHWLAKQGFIVNSPTAGRGASLFLNINQHDLVLRHYRRGGMVRSISEKSYVWQGLNRTRAWREFDVLCSLEQEGLPAPRPYACQVQHSGATYSATLITHYLDGITLAERMCTAKLTLEQWHAIGHCISLFHVAGVNHADLNAHNILLTESGQVSVIDFDRASIHRKKPCKYFESNLKRLRRSLRKIDSSGPAHYNEHCWVALIRGYEKEFKRKPI